MVDMIRERPTASWTGRQEIIRSIAGCIQANSIRLPIRRRDAAANEQARMPALLEQEQAATMAFPAPAPALLRPPARKGMLLQKSFERDAGHWLQSRRNSCRKQTRPGSPFWDRRQSFRAVGTTPPASSS